MRNYTWPHPPVPGAFGFPLGFVATIGATLIAVAVGATGYPIRSVVLLAVAVAAVSAVTTLRAAVVTAVFGWGLHDGFVLGRQGDLVFTVNAGVALAILVATAVTVVAVAGAVRIALARQPAQAPVLPVPRHEAVPQHEGVPRHEREGHEAPDTTPPAHSARR